MNFDTKKILKNIFNIIYILLPIIAIVIFFKTCIMEQCGGWDGLLEFLTSMLLFGIFVVITIIRAVISYLKKKKEKYQNQIKTTNADNTKKHSLVFNILVAISAFIVLYYLFIMAGQSNFS